MSEPTISLTSSSRTLSLSLPNGQRKDLVMPDELSVEALGAVIEQQWPELWGKCYPRIYEDRRIADFYSTKLLAADLASTVVERSLALMNPQTGSHRSSGYNFIVANHLARFQVPTFFLSRALAEAIRHTTPPIAFAWHDMQLPFEAAVFMLPKGVLKHAEDGDCMYVAYARSKRGDFHDAPLAPGSPFGVINGGFLLFAGTVRRRIYHYHWPYEHPEQSYPVIQLNDLDEAMALKSDDTSPYFFPGGMTSVDDAFLREAAHYIFGVILILLNRSDLVERGRLLKRVHRGERTREFWTPNILGAQYRVARAVSVGAGSGTSPRMHWRRGHWRQQPYGPKATLRRDTWIEPMLVNAE